MQPSPSVAKRGSAVAAKSKKTKAGQTLTGVSSMKSMQYPSTGATGRAPVTNQEPAEGTRLIGRKVLTRWPDDKNFYEAVITDYNPQNGRHHLVYDINKANETWEWVDLRELPEGDIQWEGEVLGVPRRTDRGGPGRSVKKPVGRGGAVPGASKGRGGSKNQMKKDFLPSQNGIGKKRSDDIEILHTDTLIKEVERVFAASHPDPFEMEKAKKVLKEHEKALIDAIDRLADASGGESEEGEHRYSHGQSMDPEREWRSRQYDAMGREGRGEGSDGDQMDGEGRVASDDRHDSDDADDDI